MPEDPTATANDERLPDSPVQNSPVPEIKQPSPSPFDFHGAMRRLGGHATSMFSVVDQVDDILPAGPIVVHSERAGGGAKLNNILHIMHIAHILNTQATTDEGKSFKFHSICLRNICLHSF